MRVQNEELVFSPVTLLHIAPAGRAALETIHSQLPPWDAARWQSQTQPASSQRQGTAAMPTLAADSPWDIRNFAQYLNGDQHSQNGWLQVQCPEHGGEGHSGNSLHINEQTGQYKCHGSCDSQAVYAAAWELAESRGWQPPKKAQAVTINPETALSSSDTAAAPALQKQQLSRWERYSAGIDEPPGPQRDLRIAKRAIADGLSRKQAISLLAKNSPKAQKLYRDEGSTPAYNYVEMVVKAAQQQGTRAQVRLKSKGTER